MTSPKCCEILRMRIDALTMSDLNEIIRRAVPHSRTCLIANHNLNSLRLCHKDPQMRAFYDKASYVHADGMGVVLLARILRQPLLRIHRTTYADWMSPLMSLAAANAWRVFYLGSAPGVAEQGAERLRAQFPSLVIRTADGFFNADPWSVESRRRLASIRDFAPHILMVGMGMPRQERWILANLEQISNRVILQCGAAMDYVAGAVRTPPRFAGRLGLEWAFRLASEPRRLWRRYLVEPWSLVPIVLANRRMKTSPYTEEGDLR